MSRRRGSQPSSSAVRGYVPPGAPRKRCIANCERRGEDKEAEQQKLYQKLVETTEQMVLQEKKVVQVLSVLGQETEKVAHQLMQRAEEVLPLVERVITQTRRRVLEKKKVATEEKVLSLFEPHTRAIPRRHPVARSSSLDGTSCSTKWKGGS